jgi:hypothetical protein
MVRREVSTIAALTSATRHATFYATTRATPRNHAVTRAPNWFKVTCTPVKMFAWSGVPPGVELRADKSVDHTLLYAHTIFAKSLVSASRQQKTGYGAHHTIPGTFARIDSTRTYHTTRGEDTILLFQADHGTVRLNGTP